MESSQVRVIPGIEDKYKACSTGRIFSHKKDGYLREKIDRDGYKKVNLYSDKVHLTCSVHLLIAKAFHGDLSETLQIDHKDGDKDNNQPANLEWVTCKENIRRAWKNGQSFIPKGAENKTSKSVLQFNLAGGLIREWGCMSEAARYLNGTPVGIYNACRGLKPTYKGFLWKYKKVNA